MGAAISDFRVCPPLANCKNLMFLGFIDTLNPNKNIPLESSVTSGETTRRKRRFSRHKEINRNQNYTVVNLSSNDLKLTWYVLYFFFNYGYFPNTKSV
jgi:hypothetical protein